MEADMSDGFHVTIEICGMNRRNVRERVTVWFARKKEKKTTSGSSWRHEESFKTVRKVGL